MSDLCPERTTINVFATLAVRRPRYTGVLTVLTFAAAPHLCCMIGGTCTYHALIDCNRAWDYRSCPGSHTVGLGHARDVNG